MQWDGQELNTQLFSPNGPAQEVPVSPTLEVVNERNHKLEGFTPPPLLPAFLPTTNQDLVTSSLLSEDGHKAYLLPHRTSHSQLPVCQQYFNGFIGNSEYNTSFYRMHLKI